MIQSDTSGRQVQLKKSELYTQPNLSNCDKNFDATRLLGLIASRIEPNKENVVIIDLDGCLINNLPRQYEIVQQKMLHYNFPKIAESAKFEYQKYYNILHSINIDIAQHEDVKTLFLSHFLQNEYIKYDLPIPGAVNFVKKLINLPIQELFLTGRHHQDDSDTMRSGTLDWLRKYEFLHDEIKTKVALKPNKEISDMDWKCRYIKELASDNKINIIALIDNESATLNSCRDLLPNALIVKFNGAQTDATNYQGLLLLSSWEL